MDIEWSLRYENKKSSIEDWLREVSLKDSPKQSKNLHGGQTHLGKAFQAMSYM